MDEIPLVDLRAQYAAIRAEIQQAVARVLESQGFVMGPEVERLEKEIAGYVGTRHAVSCASGSDAILLSLMAAGVRAGHAVICPAYTFFATAGAVARLGARPVFADIDPATYNVAAGSVAAALGREPRVSAIMPVHLFGRTADVRSLESIASERGVPILEDAAQAIGARDEEGRAAGTLGRIACFSFFPSKNLGAYGDGGLLTTEDDELADRLRLLRSHGARPKYHHRVVGMNSRLDALQAAVLRVKLRHLDRWQEARRRNADHYDEMFFEAGAADSRSSLADGATLLVPARPRPPARHVFHQYVIRVPAKLRDPLRQYLRDSGIRTEVYYPVPLHMQECFAPLGYRPGDLSESEQASAETLALPIYPELTKEQRERVAGAVISYFRRSR